MKCAIYMRVANKNQLSQEAIEIQKIALTELAEKSGMEIVEEYSDVGFSGNNTNRPGMQALIADYSAGKFENVLTHDMTRLSRKPMLFPFPVQTLK